MLNSTVFAPLVPPVDADVIVIKPVLAAELAHVLPDVSICNNLPVVTDVDEIYRAVPEVNEFAVTTDPDDVVVCVVLAVVTVKFAVANAWLESPLVSAIP